MNLIDFWHKLTGVTPQDLANFEQVRKHILGEYTPAELQQMEAEEVANYVYQIAPFADRRSWLASDGLTYWEEYVTDQQGREHIISSGCFYAGVPNVTPQTEIVFAEVVDAESAYAWRLLDA